MAKKELKNTSKLPNSTEAKAKGLAAPQRQPDSNGEHHPWCFGWSYRSLEKPLQTHSLWCFQSHHATNTTRELTPFRNEEGTLAPRFLHQSWKIEAVRLGVQCCRWTNENILNQSSPAITHEIKRCCTISPSWSQRGQQSRWSKPHLTTRSAI